MFAVVRDGKIKLRICFYDASCFRSVFSTPRKLFIGHASGFITDAEFLLFHQENSSDNLDFPYDNYPRFSLQDQSEADCKANFRLEKHHVGRLVDALLIPAIFKCDQGTICEGLKAFVSF